MKPIKKISLSSAFQNNIASSQLHRRLAKTQQGYIWGCDYPVLGVKKPSSLVSYHKGDLTGSRGCGQPVKDESHGNLQCSFGTLPLGFSHAPHTFNFLPFPVWLQKNNLTSLTLQVLICKTVLTVITILQVFMNLYCT